MDYTLSDSFFTHTGTGQRLHKEVQAVPTAVSDKDLNSIIWSLMEVVKAGGLAGVQFDPDLPSSYSLLLQAIRNINQAASSDIPGRVGMFLQPTPPPGWMRMNGALLSRVVFPELWAHVQVVGAVSEADWTAGRQGWFSAGDGSTTFRIPLVGGDFIRALDDGRGVDIGRLIGSSQAGSNAAHVHPVVDPMHGHVVNDPAHAHTGSTSAQADHTHAVPAGVDAGYVYGGSAGIGNNGTMQGGYPGGAGFGNSWSNIPNTGNGGAHSHTTTANPAATGISLNAAATGISVSSQGSEAKPRNIAWPFYLKY